MDKNKITYGDVLFFENGNKILVGPPSGDHNDCALQFSAIEITDDGHNCKFTYEFYNIDDLLSCYGKNSKIIKIINVKDIN